MVLESRRDRIPGAVADARTDEHVRPSALKRELHAMTYAEGAAALATEANAAPVQMSADERKGDTWNAAYLGRTSYLGKSEEEYIGGLGEVRATTEGGLSKNEGRGLDKLKGRKGAGTPAAPEITYEVLREIFPGMAADVDNDTDPEKGREKKAKGYVGYLNMAFRTMKIDTVEAQAVYLGHAFVESDQFRQFTETQGAVDKGAHKWEDDPTKVATDKNDLRQRYEGMRSVNPGGNYEFIGRGPVQVTHRAEYVETIEMIEKAGDDYEKQAATDPKAKEMAELCRRCALEVKADPRMAAKPEYTFLFSAATMKRMGADVSAAGVAPGVAWTGDDAASGWVAGNKLDPNSAAGKALQDKANAYANAYRVLMREAKAHPPAPKTPAPEPEAAAGPDIYPDD